MLAVGGKGPQGKEETKMKNFENIGTLEELKAAYKKLAFANHPDRGGSTEKMQEINAEYEVLFERVKNIHKKADGTTYQKETTEAPREWRETIEKLLKMGGVIVEVIGSFLWLSEETKEYKEEIKALGFRWSATKKMWYKSPEGYKKKSKKAVDIDSIREMFGSTVVKSGATPAQKKAIT